MARLDKEQLLEELKVKNLTLDTQSQEYKNINSIITVNCEEGHRIETSLKIIRRSNFRCPICEGKASIGMSAPNTQSIPPKRGFRVIGFDNATQSFGISIFENGNLIYYTVLTFRGDTVDRLNAIRDTIENIIIPIWEPDFIQFEDVQLQGKDFKAFKTYEVLVKLVGVIEMACARFAVRCDKARSNIWRSSFLINGKGREEEKKKAIAKVKEMYGLKVMDDIAEAILVAKYRVNLEEKKERKDLF